MAGSNFFENFDPKGELEASVRVSILKERGLLHAMEDKDLLNGLKNDRKEALEAAIGQYAAYVAAVIRNRLGPSCRKEDAEEIASTVFFTLWQERHRIRSVHLRGWLGRVAKNCAGIWMRKNRNDRNQVSLEDVILVDRDRASGLLEAQERTRILKKALLELGEPDSAIFIRYYYHEESVSSIAQRLNMHPEAVKSRLRRGRTKLKEILQEEGYER